MLRPLKWVEVERGLKSLPKWFLQKKALVRVESFQTYLKALGFVGRLGRRAEREDHHPHIVINYKTVTIRFSTHSMHCHERSPTATSVEPT